MQQQRPFSGIKVLGVTRVYAAPFAAYQLALHGAEVINIEDPGDGDTTRTNGGPNCKPYIARHMSPPFLAHAAGKKSLTLNLRTDDGKAIFKQLAAKADILIENLRGGSMEAMGLGYQDIRAINPRIIYASLTGYGHAGSKKRDAAIDAVIQAASGLMSLTGKPESGPVKVGATVVDYASGLALTTGILTALFHRERTGEGQHVDVSMLESALLLMSGTMSDVMNAGLETKLTGNGSANGSHVSDVFACADERFIMIAANKANLRPKLWKALERPDIPLDARFKDLESIRANYSALYAEIERTTRTRPAQEWEDRLNAEGAPCMKVNTLAEIVRHPQLEARGFFQSFENVHAYPGKVDVPLTSYRLSATPPHADTPPPVLGAHTEEILRGLGYGDADFEKLRGNGTIGDAL